jgi:hypothetical protein
MYDIKLRYLASVFLDVKDVVPTTTVAQRLAEAVHRLDLVPYTFAQLTPTGMMPRIGLRTQENDWFLMVQTERIDFARLPTAADCTILMDFETFCREAIDILSSTAVHFDRNATRMTAVQEGLLPEMSPEQLRRVMERLLNLPRLYASGSIPEWSWHCVGTHERSFGRQTEVINLITKVSRVQGQLTLAKPGQDANIMGFDRIRVDLDTNTLPASSVPRFGAQDIADFFTSAASWHAELRGEIKPFVEG